MYFDFEDYRPDIQPVGRAISWINPRYLPEADQPLFRADKAMNAAADAVESAFGS